MVRGAAARVTHQGESPSHLCCVDCRNLLTSTLFIWASEVSLTGGTGTDEQRKTLTVFGRLDYRLKNGVTRG
jgi:hypothetical protein